MQALRGHLPFVDRCLIEAVLERIRDRRVHLLESFCRKYQRSLFAQPALNQRRLRGYLIRVAQVESWHVPADDLQPRSGRAFDLAAVIAPSEDESDDLAGPGEPRRLAGLLATFWGPANGFTREQRLEHRQGP